MDPFHTPLHVNTSMNEIPGAPRKLPNINGRENIKMKPVDLFNVKGGKKRQIKN